MPGEKTTRSGYVYIMQWRDLCKIGYSNNPQRRQYSLARTYPGLRLLGTVFNLDARGLEGRLHQAYKGYRVRGEWFRLPLQLLHKLIPDLPPGTAREFVAEQPSSPDVSPQPDVAEPVSPVRRFRHPPPLTQPKTQCRNGLPHLWQLPPSRFGRSYGLGRCTRCGGYRRFPSHGPRGRGL